MTKRLVHMCVCIEGALKLRSLTWLEDDNGNQLSTKQAKKLLKEELAKGKKYLVSGECDNLDAEGRCMGHEIKELAT